MSITNFLTDTVGLWKQRPTSEIELRDDLGPAPDVSDAPPDTRRLIRNRQYCRVLTNDSSMPFDDLSLDCSWSALKQEMALVPAGEICLASDLVISTPNGFELLSNPDELVAVDPLYLDRDCITNADFLRFVQADGYGSPQYWPEEVLPNVLQFIDATGCPGPKNWTEGAPPANRLNHPVTGVCWYEANAYATWVGKRLPSTEEWQRAGTWPKGHSGNASELRYPWGNAFDPTKANLWASDQKATVPVGSYKSGYTPNGVGQLIGNVWEWVDTQFYPNAEEGVSVLLDETMAEIRGGAFDTYFHSQATCQFRTGQPLLFRGGNIGFRCCISENALPSRTQSDSAPIETQDDE